MDADRRDRGAPWQRLRVPWVWRWVTAYLRELAPLVAVVHGQALVACAHAAMSVRKPLEAIFSHLYEPPAEAVDAPPAEEDPPAAGEGR